jgi:glucokinase
VQRDRVRLTNANWTIEAAAVARALDGATVVLVNDFLAAARGLDALPPERFSTLQSGRPDARAPELVIGAGTGLGVAFRLPQADGVRILDGEGGHVGYAPADERQHALARWLHARLGRVSAEHVVSGPGIVRIERFLRESSGARAVEEGDARQVAARARAGDAVAQHALELFAECYGAVAGDFALALRTVGGVMLCGSLAADLLRLPELASAFLRGFTAKGPHAALAAGIPVRLAPDVPLGVLGAALIAGDGDGLLV